MSTARHLCCIALAGCALAGCGIFRVSELPARRYLAARFGKPCLRRAVLSRPGAPLAEWRVDWLDEEAAA